jgi:hypothetical protein
MVGMVFAERRLGLPGWGRQMVVGQLEFPVTKAKKFGSRRQTMKLKIILCLALILSGDFFGSGCATSHSDVWEYKTIRRLDCPGLNNPAFSFQYAFPWKRQLNLYEQQGWHIDSVKISEEGLPSGNPTEATIVLKRIKK